MAARKKLCLVLALLNEPTRCSYDMPDISANEEEQPPDLIAAFRAQLLTRPSIEVVRRHITYGTCCKLTDDQYYQLKHEVSEEYDLHPSEVIVVGSAKLGFSIAPDKRYSLFNDESDLDIAVISSRLFDIVWKEIHFYSNEITFWPERSQFYKYLSQGWIRPDKLPKAKLLKFSDRWFDFFRSLSNSKNYGEVAISAGLYKDWIFLEKYQEKSVIACADSER